MLPVIDPFKTFSSVLMFVICTRHSDFNNGSINSGGAQNRNKKSERMKIKKMLCVEGVKQSALNID